MSTKKRTLYERAYYPLFVMNRLLLTSIIVLLYQLILIFFYQVAIIVYLMRSRPFRSNLLQVIVVTDKFTIIIELILLYFLYKHQNSIEKRAKIGNISSQNYFFKAEESS